MVRTDNKTPPQCPCGSGRIYGECCGRYILGEADAPTAEALMRSRYVAYVERDEAYLRRTWYPAALPGNLDLNNPSHLQWLGLNIVGKQAGGERDDHGVVEFIAKFKINGRAQRLHEKSRFVKEGGRWFYVDGEFA